MAAMHEAWPNSAEADIGEGGSWADIKDSKGTPGAVEQLHAICSG